MLGMYFDLRMIWELHEFHWKVGHLVCLETLDAVPAFQSHGGRGPFFRPVPLLESVRFGRAAASRDALVAGARRGRAQTWLEQALHLGADMTWASSGIWTVAL